MKRSLVVLSVLSLVFCGLATAEVKKGDVLLDFAAGWTRQNVSDDLGGNSIDVLFGTVRPGMALTDHIRVAGLGAVVRVDSDIADATVWAAGVSGEYVFMPSNMLNPYIGAQIAWASADLDDDDASGWLWGPRLGVLFTLNPANNLFAEYQYQRWEGDIGDALEDGHMILLGIEHKFKVGP